MRESSVCWMYTRPFLLSGVTVLPFRDIFPARNSTRYLLEEPREPGTRLGNNAPEDILEREKEQQMGPETFPYSLLSISHFNLYQASATRRMCLAACRISGQSTRAKVEPGVKPEHCTRLQQRGACLLRYLKNNPPTPLALPSLVRMPVHSIGDVLIATSAAAPLIFGLLLQHPAEPAARPERPQQLRVSPGSSPTAPGSRRDRTVVPQPAPADPSTAAAQPRPRRRGARPGPSRKPRAEPPRRPRSPAGPPAASPGLRPPLPHSGRSGSRREGGAGSP